MIRKLSRVLSLALALSAPVAARAQGPAAVTLGALRIEQPWSRATPRAAPVAGGYLKITNTGAEPDRLVSVATPVAGKPSIHEMTMDGGVMKMRPLAAGLAIGAGASVELKPGGYHLMFEDLKGGLTEGQTFRATLVFEKAGRIDVEFAVLGMGATSGAAAPAAAGMDHDHNH